MLLSQRLSDFGARPTPGGTAVDEELYVSILDQRLLDMSEEELHRARRAVGTVARPANRKRAARSDHSGRPHDTSSSFMMVGAAVSAIASPIANMPWY